MTHRISAAAAVPAPANPTLGLGLADVDPEVYRAIAAELDRQETTLEMIASENFAPLAGHAGAGLGADQQVRRGLPGPPLLRRLRARRRRSSSWRSTGSRRCSAPSTPTCSRTRARRPTPRRCPRCCSPGDTILGLDLAHGGHLTHGMRLNFSGKLYNVAAYHVREDDHLVDMAEVERLAREHRPEADHRRLVGLPAAARLRRVPPDRRRGRRLPDGRHGALRRPGRRRPAPLTRCRTRTSSPPPRTRPSAARAAASS